MRYSCTVMGMIRSRHNIEHSIHSGIPSISVSAWLKTKPLNWLCWFSIFEQSSIVMKTCQAPSSYWVKPISSFKGSNCRFCIVLNKFKIILAGTSSCRSSQAFSSSSSISSNIAALWASLWMSPLNTSIDFDWFEGAPVETLVLRIGTQRK